MTANRLEDSSELEELLEHREMDVTCWHCGSTQQLTVRWVSTHRDMRCAQCETLIVLNTSRMQSEVARLRRQLSALHAQMSGVLGEPRRNSSAPRASDPRRLTLALATAHPFKLGSPLNAPIPFRK